jgi:hypothetical protein
MLVIALCQWRNPVMRAGESFAAWNPLVVVLHGAAVAAGAR